MAKSFKAAIVLFPGSNRDGDVARALKQAGAEVEVIWHSSRQLPVGTELVVLPGGFSYGDYLRCGAIAARAKIMDAVARHAERGGLVLGICNGFQILCEAGILPGVLTRNTELKFICRMQKLRVETNKSRFTGKYEENAIVTYAIAHGEGAFIASEQEIDDLERGGRVAFRYCDPSGHVSRSTNPNGSIHNIAGIYSPGFNVLGLMPHPENLIDPLAGGTDGAALFAGLLAV